MILLKTSERNSIFALVGVSTTFIVFDSLIKFLVLTLNNLSFITKYLDSLGFF